MVTETALNYLENAMLPTIPLHLTAIRYNKYGTIRIPYNKYGRLKRELIIAF